jgi:hypothetical protein
MIQLIIAVACAVLFYNASYGAKRNIDIIRANLVFSAACWYNLYVAVHTYTHQGSKALVAVSVLSSFFQGWVAGDYLWVLKARFPFKFWYEEAHVISDAPAWCFEMNDYLYISATLPGLIWVVVTEWQDEKHLLG